MSPAGESAGRGRLTARALSELLVDLAGEDGSDVIVLAILPREAQPSTVDRTRRPDARSRIHRPVGLPSAEERPPADSGWSSLTPREQAVACLASQALTNQQIANRLGISPHTVNFHLRQIFKKLGIDSRVSLPRIVPPRPPVVDSAREHRP
jgi:DNA-binding CsgD family transcriptional regulator